VIRLITPPLPAASRPSKITITLHLLRTAMHLNANLPAVYFGVPATQVVEVGVEVEI